MGSSPPANAAKCRLSYHVWSKNRCFTLSRRELTQPALRVGAHRHHIPSQAHPARDARRSYVETGIPPNLPDQAKRSPISLPRVWITIGRRRSPDFYADHRTLWHWALWHVHCSYRPELAHMQRYDGWEGVCRRTPGERKGHPGGNRKLA
jgi:hypothetical protein